MEKQTNSIPIGTSDYYGKEATIREYVLDEIKQTYNKYGFETLYTPIIEKKEVFTGHHGEGEKLLFELADKNGEKYVLKYDSTVPLARVIGTYGEIKMPYKRYQLQPSFRDDSVDKGHYREFIQCDGDIIGSKSLLSDSEIIAISYEGLKRLGFEDFTIRLNHRKLIQAIAEKAKVYDAEGLLEIQRAIDYADKITKDGIAGIKKDLEKRNINPEVIDIICELLQITNKNLKIEEVLKETKKYFHDNKNATTAINELEEIVSYLPNEIKEKCKIDYTLARGADYYTGFIIEAVINNIKLGAVLGGGRYDNLIGKFGNKDIPAVGMAFGLERLIVAMKELGLDRRIDDNKKIAFYVKNDQLSESFTAIERLREKYFVLTIAEEDLDYTSFIEYCQTNEINLGATVKDGELCLIKFDDSERVNDNYEKHVRTRKD